MSAEEIVNVSIAAAAARVSARQVADANGVKCWLCGGAGEIEQGGEPTNPRLPVTHRRQTFAARRSETCVNCGGRGWTKKGE